MGVPVSLPRFKHNHPIQNCQDYYRITGYIPLLDSFLEDLKVRFWRDTLPQNIKDVSYGELQNITTDILENFA